MEWVEASGKSLAEAKDTVLDLLGVAEDDAEFLILSEPKPGLFGRLRGEARVQGRVRPVTPPPKRSGRPRSDRRGRGRAGTTGRDGGRPVSTGEPGERARSGAGSAAGNGQAGGSGGGVGTAARRPDGGTTSGTTSGRSRRRRRSRGGGQRDNPAAREREPAGEAAEGGRQPGGPAEEREATMERSLSLEEQGEAARRFLSGLIEEFGLDATVTVSKVDDDTVQASAAGGDLGLLVGPRGSTLAAVQDLTRTYVQRQSESRTDRIIVDVGGYRDKRAAALRRFTLTVADEVKASGEERALEPMSPADRKVVHDTVTGIEGVETRSDGVEPDRYVVISPSLS